jgi:phage host-nuclease inhibitor protein Gam
MSVNDLPDFLDALGLSEMEGDALDNLAGDPFPDIPDLSALPAKTQRLRVNDKSQAEWCLRQVARIKKQQAEVESIAQAEIEKISAWRDREASSLGGTASFFESLLIDFHCRTLEADGKAKTIRLPSGSLQARAQQPEFIRNEETLLPWVKQNRPEFVLAKQSVDWSNLKKEIVVNNGIAIDQLTGEVLPVQVVERGPAFSVKVGA